MKQIYLIGITWVFFHIGFQLVGQTYPNVVVLLADDLGYLDVGCYVVRFELLRLTSWPRRASGLLSSIPVAQSVHLPGQPC